MFISTDHTKFAKACTAVMVFAASAMLPEAAMASSAGAGGGENGADVIELRRWRLLVEVLGDLPLMLDVEAAIKGEIPS